MTTTDVPRHDPVSSGGRVAQGRDPWLWTKADHVGSLPPWVLRTPPLLCRAWACFLPSFGQLSSKLKFN